VTTPTPNPYIALLQGQRFDQFLIGDYRASGQFSLVFEAKDTNSDTDVAVKVLVPAHNPEDLFEFQREADLLCPFTGSGCGTSARVGG
jgi:hypothetical protein